MKKILALLILFCLIAFPVFAATYYVDATDGDDSKDGLSEANAWKTIAKVNSSSFSPGDSILFKKGETWHEQLSPPSSGSSGNPITFSSYGSGSDPIITGDDTRSLCVKLDNDNYLMFVGLIIERAESNGFRFLNGSSNTIIDNCTFRYNDKNGVHADDGDGPAMDSNVVKNSTVHDNGENGIYLGRYATDWLIQKNTVHDNSYKEAGTAGIQAWGSTSSGHIIERNTIYDDKESGIWIDVAGTGIIVRSNKVYDNKKHGIIIERTSYADVYFNIIYGHFDYSGIFLKGDTTNTARYNDFFANSSYNNREGVEVMGDGVNGVLYNTFKNNKVTDNISQDWLIDF
jgi:parallel beta-helix repeat protein